ncbi:MAG: ABC transporter substrate-binding protein [Actinomycetota bacterium]
MAAGMKQRSRTWVLLSALAALVLLAGACGGGSSDTETTEGGDPSELALAIQPGMSYAPLIIIRDKGWLEDELPDTKITWQVLDSGSAIRDGMVAGDLHVGAGGIGPFLVGRDAGIDWKLLSGLNEMDLWLMAEDSGISGLDDFASGDKIAMPAPDSIQAVVLKKGAEEELGDAAALDENIVAMDHPTGFQALLSGQIAGHLTSPPFQFDEEKEGAEPILTSFDLFGNHTFNSVFVQQEFYDQNTEAMETLNDLIGQAIDMINENPQEAAEILAADSGGKPDAKTYEDYLGREGVAYTQEVSGYETFGEFMAEIELIQEPPGPESEYSFPTISN